MATQFPTDCLQASLAGARLLECPPRLIRGSEAELIATVLPVLQTSCVILDMSAVEVIDAGGVGSLMMLRQVAEQSGTTLSLINPTQHTREILTVLGLDSVLLCKDA